MAFEAARVTPESTTVASYEVTRLTNIIRLKTAMVETNRGWVPLDVIVAADPNGDGVFEELHVAPPVGFAVTALPVGMVVVTEAGVPVGPVGSVETVPPVPPTQTTAGVAGYVKVVLSTGGVASSAAVSLKIPQLNMLGVQVQNPAVGGLSYTLVLSSDDTPQAARMQQMLLNVQVALITKALAQLGVAKTAPEVAAAATAMMQNGESVESLIATEMEQLEKDRRAGSFTSVRVIGAAP